MPRRRRTCINCGYFTHLPLCRDCFRAGLVTALLTGIGEQLVRWLVAR